MYYYVEEWKPRQKWLALTPEDRGKFLFDISPAMHALTETGIELVGYVMNEADGDHRNDCRFLRLWKIPEKESVEQIDHALEMAGWDEFFEPGGTRGEILSPQVAIPYLVGA